MFTEVLGASLRKELLVDLNECLTGQVTVGTISLEEHRSIDREGIEGDLP